MKQIESTGKKDKRMSKGTNDKKVENVIIRYIMSGTFSNNF